MRLQHRSYRITLAVLTTVLSLSIGLPSPMLTVSQDAAADASSEELVLAAPRDLAPGEQDPYYTAATLHVWESLVTVDENWVPQPQLAESWEQSEDGLSWTFRLRQDVVFSDGTPFDADVVVTNIERNRQISPRSSPFYSLDAEIAYGSLERVEPVDPFTVRFIHATPEPTFPAMIATYFSAMFAPHSFTESGDFSGPPITTGPLRVVERAVDQYVLLAANETYWGTPAASQSIRVRTIPDPNTRVSALRSGEIHGVLDLGAIQPASALELTGSGDFVESVAPIAITHYIFVNGAKQPWDDARLRQAVSLAMDRDRIVDDLFFGYGAPAGSMLSNVSTQWHDPSIRLPYDEDEAVRLAGEVLATDRIPAIVLIPSYQIDRYPYKALGEYVQAQLEPLGIDAEIRILDGAAFNEATRAGEYDLALRIQGLSSSEPESLFAGYLGEGGGTNASMSLGYRNPVVEDALVALTTTSDPDERRQLYTTIQTEAATDLPIIPLFYERGVVVCAADVEGYELSTNGGVSLDTARIPG